MNKIVIGLLFWSLSVVSSFAQWEHPALALYENAQINAVEFRLDSKETQQWDGEEWSVSSRVDHSYEGLNRTLSEYYSFLPAEMGLGLTRRVTRSFENGRLIEEVDETADLFTGELDNDTRELYNYESPTSDVITEQITQEWDGEEWVNAVRELYENSDGIPLAGTTQEWQDGEWVNTDRYEVEQDGNTLSIIDYIWGGEDWAPSGRTDFEGSTIEDIFYPFQKYAINLNDVDTFVLISLFPDYVEYEWNELDGVYEEVFRQISSITTDGSGNLEERVITLQVYESDGGTWVDEDRVTVGFDDFEDPISGLLETIEDGEWVAIYQEEYEYDDNRNIIRSITDINEGEGFVDYSETEYSWSQVTAIGDSDERITKNEIGSAYPNPFNPSITIPFELSRANEVEITVFDILGRKIESLFNGMKPAGENVVRFDASDLPSGMYLIQVKIDQESSIQRVTLLK